MSGGFEQWYIRVRGRVSGPYDLQKLRGLKSRGRLSRVHEVSLDGQTWSPATTVYGLFEDDGAGVGDVPGSYGGGQPMEMDGGYDLQSPGDEWYYSSDGGQQGPVAASELQQMVGMGRLPASTLVWRSGQGAWMAADQVPELGLAPPVASPPQPRSTSRILARVLFLLIFASMPVGTWLVFHGHKLFRDPLLVGNIESTAASQQITQAVGLVVNGWETIDSNNKRRDRDYMLGGPFDGPYTKETEGIATIFKRVRPAESLAVIKTKDLYEKVERGYRPLPEGGLCVVQADGPSQQVHALSGTGTCFLITKDGYALTNRHVVEETFNLQKSQSLIQEIARVGDFRNVKPTIWVFLGERQHDAEIVYVSDKFDLAVLKIAGEQPFPHFALAAQVDEEHLPRGNRVYVLGFPGAAQLALSEQELQLRHARQELGTLVSDRFSSSDYAYSQHDGSISKIAQREQVGMVVQHNADINPGNSGGPLVTRDGRVHAINTATVKGASGIHFSIAIDQLRDEINQHVKTPPLWR